MAAASQTYQHVRIAYLIPVVPFNVVFLLQGRREIIIIKLSQLLTIFRIFTIQNFPLLTKLIERM